MKSKKFDNTDCRF